MVRREPGHLRGRKLEEELNPESLVVVPKAKLEPWAAPVKPGERYQFERIGYFRVDKSSHPGKLVFNRTVILKDTWAKTEKKQPNPEKKVEKKAETPPNEIGIDEFSKCDLREGIVREAGLVEGTDKLIRAMVDLGEGRNRHLCRAAGNYPDPAVLVGQA